MRWTGKPSSFSHRWTVRVVLFRRSAMLFQPSSLSRTAGVTSLQGFHIRNSYDIPKHVNELRLPEMMVESIFGYPHFC